jgi:hypothetical protein
VDPSRGVADCARRSPDDATEDPGSIPGTSTENSILRSDLEFVHSVTLSLITRARGFLLVRSRFGFYSRKVSCLLGLVLFRSEVSLATARGW